MPALRARDVGSVERGYTLITTSDIYDALSMTSLNDDHWSEAHLSGKALAASIRSILNWSCLNVVPPSGAAAS